ncbi:unnamed protein product [Durusdinium trenchii]|uniref:Uncharacterized protein n=1 Tax=Durusdinium trenchii TaxID=1381693 RepID=A0ABP0H9U8_9DINO
MDDSMFMSLSSESVKIWSASTGRCVRTLPSGYGLCGFFLAGNEHVLIGTKDPATPKPRAENDVERVQSVGCVYGCAN